MDDKILLQAAILLAAAAIAAPLAKRLRIGSVLGYLAVGILIGPYGLGFIFEVYQLDSIRQIAELGIVLLLFLIGLELKPMRLWAMRRSIFGAGSVQVAVTGAIVGVVVAVWGMSWTVSAVIGIALAMSSTAFVLQVLEEKKELSQRHGRLAFSILLFQDLAAIPLIAIVPMLAAEGTTTAGAALLAMLKAAVTIAAVVLGGRFVLNRLYRLIAASGVREAMTASALLTVIGVALAMHAAGLSAALGAFIAGAMLADSEYRHQIEADIHPFEGLLLGLFFTAIGMSLDLALLQRELPLLLALAAALITVKVAVLYAVGRWQGLSGRGARRLGLAMSQGGEFAFVILGLIVGTELLEQQFVDRLAVVVTLSMAATPFLLLIDSVIRRALRKPEPVYDVPRAEEGHVVIAGFGRVGQIVARVLRAKRIPFTALEINPAQVDFVRRFGSRVYYGDASRLDILEAAQTDKARAFVLAIDDVDASIKTAQLVRQHFPHVPMYARARNRQHVYRLMDLGITNIRRETFLASLDLTRGVLRGLGLNEAEVMRTADAFMKLDRKRLYEDYKLASDMEKLQAQALKYAEELEQLFNEDIAQEKEQEQAAAKSTAGT
ncbi:MAG: monovalent cation:proton antiporter-2 (CPA2) family protein [Bacteroidota bacterium]